MILIVGGAFQGKEVAARNMARKMGGGTVALSESWRQSSAVWMLFSRIRRTFC